MIKIAIVEDEAMYAKQLEEFLHQYEAENHEAFDITIYSDGDQIVNKYKSQFDIILMDVEMKFMDGMSAAEEIRKMDSEVVIIFITNMAVCNQRLRGRCAGLCIKTGILFRIFTETESCNRTYEKARGKGHYGKYKRRYGAY